MARKDVTNGYISADMEDANDNFIELYNAQAALAAGSGVVVSANDTLAGFLNGKLVAGTNIILTENDDGGNETLTVDLAATITTRTYVDPVISGCIKDEIYAITDGAAFEINPSNGAIQTITLGDDRTPKATNFENGEAVTLLVNDGTAKTITWTDTTFGASGISWLTDGGTAPTLETTGHTAIILLKTGDQVYGARVGY